ncbi:MAG: hypothetical protein LIO43_01135, partial [Clostridiales bacterium]|nr:hypothetical protein [Clostridiales bacterium]
MKKHFSKKLLSLFLTIVMALGCFTGALSAYAAQDESDYYDDNLAYNFLGWVETTDEQTLTALLDWVDELLAGTGIKGNYSLNIVVTTINIDYDITSTDGVFSTIDSVMQLFNNTAVNLVLGGDAKSINLKGACKDYASNGSTSTIITRENSTSKEVLLGLFNILYQNTNSYAAESGNYGGGTVIQSFINGTLSLGSTLDALLPSILGNSIYGLIGDLLGMPSGYEDNMVNNIVVYLLKTLVADNYSDQGINNNIDTSSSTYYFKTSDGQQQSLEDWGEDALNNALLDTLIGVDGEYIFGDSGFSLDLQSNAYDQIYNAFVPIFEHTLLPLLGTISVQHSYVNEFTKMYYGYVVSQPGFTVPTTQAEVDSYWTEAGITNWITSNLNDVASYLDGLKDENGEQMFTGLGTRHDDDSFTATCTPQQAKDALVQLFTNLNASRTEDSIDASTLFNKVLYSPVAEALGLETGVLNLNIKDYYFGGYSNIFDMSVLPSGGSIAGNAYGVITELLKAFFPGFTAPAASAAQDLNGIVTETMNCALKLVQYVADNSSTAILSDFYSANGENAVLTESNLESAILPLVKAIIGEIGMAKQIHQETWDKCDDIDGVIFVALQEYLKYVLPDYDYSSLATVGSDGYIDTSLDQYQYMARDAVAYVMQSSVPLMEKDGSQWSTFEKGGTKNGKLVDDSTTLYDLLNKALCYYADNMNIAQLLNLTNYTVSGTSGSDGYESAINLDNTLFENIDNIVNAAFPMLPSLFKEAEGNVNSQELIIDTLVNGIINISDVNTTSYGHGGSYQGISAILANLVYMFTESAPVTKTSVINVVYIFIQDIFNVILG